MTMSAIVNPEPSRPKKPIEFKLRHPVKVEDKLYGDKFIIDLEKRHFRFSSQYEDKPYYINFNQVERFKVIHDPKNYLWAVGFILIFIVVGLLVLIYKMNLPNHRIDIVKKNGTTVSFRLNLELALAEKLRNAVQINPADPSV